MTDTTTKFRLAVPMLHVDSIDVARQFYCEQLGFREVWKFQPHADRTDPTYMGVVRDDVILHLSSFSGDGKPGGVAVVFLDDVDDYCREIANAGVDLGDGPVDQSWGNRECYISDPFGNQLRLTQPGR